MYHSKRIFIYSVLAIFTMLLISVLSEYVNLSKRLTRLDNTMDTAFEVALASSVNSEELLSDDYNAALLSTGTTNGKDAGAGNRLVANNITIYADNHMFQENPYYVAMFYAKNGRLPSTENEVRWARSQGYNNTQSVFKFLYGETAYNSLNWSSLSNRDLQYASTLPWALNKSSGQQTSANTNTYNALLGSGKYLDDFTAFYNNVGSAIKTTSITRVPSGDGYSAEARTFPTLDNMGLTSLGSGNSIYRTNFTTNNLISSVKIGKHKIGSSAQRSYYFLTPYSLGVTYVPVSVFKPVMLTQIDTVCREQLAGYNQDKDMNIAMQQATGCVSTSFYSDGNGGATAEPLKHKVGSDEKIVNNGDVEFDLNSLQVKVDYFNLNIYDVANKNVTLSALGTASSSTAENVSGSATDPLAFTIGQLKKSDTGLNSRADNSDEAVINQYGQRVIARISVKIKVHIPYKNPIIQWVCSNQSGNTNHFSMKLLGDNGNIKEDDDGVWYTTTKYYCTSR